MKTKYDTGQNVFLLLADINNKEYEKIELTINKIKIVGREVIYYFSNNYSGVICSPEEALALTQEDAIEKEKNCIEKTYLEDLKDARKLKEEALKKLEKLSTEEKK